MSNSTDPSQQPFNPKTDTYYGYLVDAPSSIALIVLFSLTGAVHLAQSIYHRVWWLTPTMFLCALGEVLGWIARYWSSQNYLKLDPFLMQICCTILSPSFLAAGLFFILGIIINRVGPQYATLPPRVFSTIFICCDLASLIVQGAGGGIASTSFQAGGSPDPGGRIMLGGIVFQLVAITMFAVTAVEFFVRWGYNKPVPSKMAGEPTPSQRPPMSRDIKYMTFGMTLATIFLYIRSIYRTIELINGWTGPIIQNQDLFDWCDGAAIFAALVTLNIFNPGRLIYDRDRRAATEDDKAAGSPTTHSPDEKSPDEIA
ncbi:hypothetical protein FRB99_004691 [Tulasnella sp. 403]|nr:hypothetical protein FRB99_004691 [Tulasnella sp. 403]